MKDQLGMSWVEVGVVCRSWREPYRTSKDVTDFWATTVRIRSKSVKCIVVLCTTFTFINWIRESDSAQITGWTCQTYPACYEIMHTK
jgi:hypothetical protein